MSIGGATGDGTLPNPDMAREFARTLFDLFLGGIRYTKIRPFGRYVKIFDVQQGEGESRGGCKGRCLGT